MCIRDRRVIESLARDGLARQQIAAVLLERHGIEVTHAVVRKVVSRDLIGRFPELRFLWAVSYTHLRAHETVLDLVCRLMLEKKKQPKTQLPFSLQFVQRIL